jgi:hypothetical protein
VDGPSPNCRGPRPCWPDASAGRPRRGAACLFSPAF